MATLASIDLPKLQLPQLIDELSSNKISTIIQQQFADEINPDNISDKDLIKNIIDTVAHREHQLRKHINDASRELLLATASGSNLDNIVALFDVHRKQLYPGDSNAVPPIAPTYESDDQLRRRAQLVFERFSTAGTIGSYLFHVLSASYTDATGNTEVVKDAAVYSYQLGKVNIYVLSNQGNGQASGDVSGRGLLGSVATIVNNITPITDTVNISSARIRYYKIAAKLIVKPQTDIDILKTKTRKALTDYAIANHQLATDVTVAGITAALYQHGVEDVILKEPIEDIIIADYEAPFIDVDKDSTVSFANAKKGLPTVVAKSMSIIDIDKIKGRITGTLTLEPGDQSANIYYAVYWGNDKKERLSNDVIVKFTDDNYSYKTQLDLLIPPQARYLLAFSGNENGEMERGISMPIIDKAVPTNHAQAIDSEQLIIMENNSTININGIVNIKAAKNDSDITLYNLYWGSKDNADKSKLIQSFDKRSSLTYCFDDATTPEKLTHLWVFTENADGEMATGVSTALLPTSEGNQNGVSQSVPTHTALGVYLLDAIQIKDGEFTGTLRIEHASDESDITHYVFYAGKNSVEKVGEAIESFEKTSTLQTTYTIDKPLKIDNSATHLLVFTKNLQGEMPEGISELIVSVGTS